MTTFSNSTTQARFEAAKLNFETARAAAAAVEPFTACHSRDRILAVLDVATDTLLRTSAPSLGAVANKLEIVWGEDLFNDDDGSANWRKMTIGDLRRIERLHAGIPEPDASGGMDLGRLATDWSDALREYSRCELLLEEGPSEAWGQNQRNDIVAMKDEAEARLLAVSAPHLDAVLKKVGLLLDEDECRPSALRDVRRLMPNYI